MNGGQSGLGQQGLNMAVQRLSPGGPMPGDQMSQPMSQPMGSLAQAAQNSGYNPMAVLQGSNMQGIGRLGGPGQMPQGLGSLLGMGGGPGGMSYQPMQIGGPMGKPMGKEDNGSPPPDIYNPGTTNVPGNYGNPANNGTPPPPQTPPPGAPPAPQQSGNNIPYSAQSYNQPFSPFQNFNQQAQGAFNPMPQTSVGSYGRWDPMTWQGIAGPWPQLFGGPGAPAQQSMGTAQNNGMTAPQQALNAQMQRWYGR